MTSSRRFPPPWQVEQIPGVFKVLDASGQALVYVYARETRQQAHTAKVTSWLIKRSNTATQTDRNLIVPTKERDVTLRKDDPTASNAVPVVGANKAA